MSFSSTINLSLLGKTDSFRIHICNPPENFPNDDWYLLVNLYVQSKGNGGKVHIIHEIGNDVTSISCKQDFKEIRNFLAVFIEKFKEGNCCFIFTDKESTDIIISEKV
jgi:hypothetical protein